MKKEEEWLEISNLEKFTNYIRTMIFVSFANDDPEQDIMKCFEELTEQEKEELNNVLEIKECITIVEGIARRVRSKKTKEIKYLINGVMLNHIIDDVNQRMVSNIIKTLVSKGVLESAFDEEKNDFIFWTKDQGK